jgi:hypothetical protein
MHSTSLTTSSPAATPTEAAMLVRRLLGAYPAANVHDPQIYIAALTAALCRYPPDVGMAAVTAITRACKFIPAVAEVCAECDARLPRPQRRAEPEPPVDAAKQARVAEMLRELAQTLRDRVRERQEEVARELLVRDAPRRHGEIERAWQLRGEASPVPLVSPELADIVKRWQAAAHIT